MPLAWIIAPSFPVAPDLQNWADQRQFSLQFYTGLDLEHPRWQLERGARPDLAIVDARAFNGMKPADRRLVGDWLLLLRLRVWDAPVLLCVARAEPEELCYWGRHEATEVLINPSAAELDKALSRWVGRKRRWQELSSAPFLAMLRESGAFLSQSDASPERWKQFLRTLLRRFRAQSGSILLLNPKGDSLIPLASHGLPPAFAKLAMLPLSGSITERVIREDRSLILQGALEKSEIEKKDRKSVRPSSALATPLRCGEKVLGSLNLARRGRAPRFSPRDLLALEILGAQAALAIENERLILRARENERLATVGRTTADISHSIKNVLTTLKGGVYLFDRGLLDDDKQLLVSAHDMMQRSVSRIQLMIGDLLDFSKKREPSPSPALLNDVIGELVKQIQQRCGEQNVALSVRIAPKNLSLLLEEDRLFRALMNLVGNALDVMPNSGKLLISCEWKSLDAPAQTPGDPAEASAAAATAPAVPRAKAKNRPQPLDDNSQAAIRVNWPYPPVGCRYENGTLSIAIVDMGPGVPPELRNKIFEEFFSTKGGRGTGLGLAMVSKFAKESGGSIEVADRPGGGSRFVLAIPAPAIHPLAPDTNLS